MNLINYNPNLELRPFGFNNLGSTCYFNAVLQSLLSCTSFVEKLLYNKNNKYYKENPVIKNITELIEMALLNNNSNDVNLINKIQQMSPNIWHKMIMLLYKKNNIKDNNYMIGQQCAREGFHCLLESMDNVDDIQNIFLHRYKNMIYCIDCKKCVSNVDSVCSLFEVQPDLKTEQIERFKKFDIFLDDNENNFNSEMNKFLLKQTGYVDKYYICPECKKKGEKYKISCLVMVPEVLVVLSKKYIANNKLDIYTDFPKELEFKGKDNLILKYEAVSQIEHSGGLNGGHYWSISRRKDGWYVLNDNQYTKSEFMPTKNTYIVFYHLMKKY